MTSKTVKNVVQ